MAETLAGITGKRRTPFLAIASAGTTNTGAIDPLGPIADLCCRENLWLHVDAAYGGAFVLCDQGRRLLAGIERADSITFDPHKGLFLPYGTGCLLARDGASRTTEILDECRKRLGMPVSASVATATVPAGY